MKKIYILIIAIILIKTSTAQQEIQFTQFMFNKTFYNPAHTGIAPSICATLFYRSQWVGFEGAPVTLSGVVESPVKFLHGGLGLRLFRDEIGFFDDVSIGLSYSYHLQLNDGVLGIGIRADLINKSLGQADWITPSGNLWVSDGSIASPASTGLSPDIALGVHYEGSKFNAGISSVRLLEAETDLQNGQGGIVKFRGRRTMIGHFGYNLPINETNIVIVPGAFIKYDFTKFQMDINAMAYLSEKFWGGISYRFVDAIAIMAGAQVFPSLALGYSYDLTTSSIRRVSSGSHEIFFRYCFKITIPPREIGSYRNVRFL
ncbi:PorP/SprF family type IX secretion system membrane protein [Schleiferia thermophila]|jgi:type IX secretion system PorP/SprF family membrane protein|uniref:Type IX secretion system PorP/SprF family membrane protein n=1 Tax=Schleiferia thermophila TaxID=884107 RepID=A0A369AAW6_9FLAO|nr:PorP/SprF family type IX secretion system membrane protein [Schleiferia thermophila]KFD38642.1 hypothetical protein AT05_09325 [Schleiferia thermophila str. Yellowstone]RCX05217.1 type IX secretion system PorP/SprF family membrane protein [Schleiferia thermophila]GCD79270.1 membrane protein [Schleiferia thermophila]